MDKEVQSVLADEGRNGREWWEVRLGRWWEVEQVHLMVAFEREFGLVHLALLVALQPCWCFCVCSEIHTA